MEKLQDLKGPLQLLLSVIRSVPHKGKPWGKLINMNKMNELCYLYYSYSVLF